MGSRKKIKIPPVGSIVQVDWLDSGATEIRTKTNPDLSKFRTYGELSAIYSENIVITMEKELTENGETDKTSIARVCIKDIKTLRTLKHGK